GEGTWGTPAPAFASENGGPGHAPPAFFETAIRPDPAHPHERVRLVALDLRQLDLRLAAGVDTPRAASGLRGSGRLPAGEAVLAAFTAGPAEPAPLASAQISPGFAVDRSVLVPPVPGAASIAIGGDGQVRLGAWPFGAALPAEIASLAQGL